MLARHRVQQGKEKLLFGEGYNPENLVFCRKNGTRLPYVEAWEAFGRFCKYSQLPNITPHGLRHTHATTLLMKGHSVNAVAERLGDDPETIMHTYAHVLPGMQEEIVRTIEQLYDDDNDPETTRRSSHVLPNTQAEMARTIEQLYDDEISK